MENGRFQFHSWKRPLVTWAEINFPALLIAAQLSVTALLFSVLSIFGAARANPFEKFAWLFWNGTALAWFAAYCSIKWIKWRKYSQWTVECDQDEVSVTDHKGIVRRTNWADFVGYKIKRSVGRKLQIFSRANAEPIELPYPGHHEIYRTTSRLVRALDSHLPIDGIREGRRPAAMSLPSWLAGLILVVSLPMLGVPIWVLALNGFRSTPEIAFEVLSRSGGLVWPCVLLGPVLLTWALCDIWSTRQKRTIDAEHKLVSGQHARYFEGFPGRIRADAIFLSGITLVLVVANFRYHGPWQALITCVLFACWGVLAIGFFKSLSKSRRRVIVGEAAVTVLTGRKKDILPIGTFTVKLKLSGSRQPDMVKEVALTTGSTTIVLPEQWGDGDWLSRALVRASCGQNLK